jgi:hypothetical protein
MTKVDVAATRPAMVSSAVAVHAAPAAAQSPKPIAATMQINPLLRSRLANMSFSAVALHGGATSTGNGAATTSSSQSTDTNISILAFICKRLPKCPDPDPSLTWT